MAKLLDQREGIRLLTDNGWAASRGGKHVVKMTKSGWRPVTLPYNHGRPYSKGLSAAIAKQAGLKSTENSRCAITVFIHHEGSEYWSEIAELPGCFASGRTLSELHEALGEAVGLHLWGEPASVTTPELNPGAGEIEVRRIE